MMQLSVPRVRNLKALRPTIFVIRSSHYSTDTKPHKPPRVPNLIGGAFVDSKSSASIDVINPATQEVVSQVPFTTTHEFQAPVSSAKHAFPSWRNTPVTTRQRIMFKLQELIRRDIDKLAFNITKEQGKTLNDAHGDVFQGLEVVEHACGMATLQMGEYVSNVSSGIDTYSVREPLGVCAGICPFNFPAMIPLWMFPMAVACGNTFILKPSEKDPGASVMLAELAMEAGLPDCVLNIVHGSQIKDFVILSDNTYTGSQIRAMEKKILEKLGWYLTVPTPYVFLARYIKASISPDDQMRHMVFFLAELGVLDYQTIIQYSPSRIAAAAVYAARCTLNKKTLWTETLKHHTGYSDEQLRACAKALVGFHLKAAECDLKAVYRKYSKQEFGAVALLTPARSLLSSS